jgi:hypothetical protein
MLTDQTRWSLGHGKPLVPSRWQATTGVATANRAAHTVVATPDNTGSPCRGDPGPCAMAHAWWRSGKATLPGGWNYDQIALKFRLTGDAGLFL